MIDLETYNGEPKEFSRVLASMMRQLTGDVKISINALRAVSISNSLIWRPTEYSHYFFTSIPGAGALSESVYLQNWGHSDHLNPPELHGIRQYTFQVILTNIFTWLCSDQTKRHNSRPCAVF